MTLTNTASTERVSENTRIEEAVTDYFGLRCEAFDPDCMSCQAWAEIQAIKDTPLRFANLIDTQDRKIEELVKALEPFAAYIALRDEIDDSMPADASAIACVDGFGRKAKSSKITYGDFRIARTTLSTIQAAKDGK